MESPIHDPTTISDFIEEIFIAAWMKNGKGAVNHAFLRRSREERFSRNSRSRQYPGRWTGVTSLEGSPGIKGLRKSVDPFCRKPAGEHFGFRRAVKIDDQEPLSFAFSIDTIPVLNKTLL